MKNRIIQYIIVDMKNQYNKKYQPTPPSISQQNTNQHHTKKTPIKENNNQNQNKKTTTPKK